MIDTWQIAIEMEKEGKAFYTELANKAGSAELKGVFEQLAAEEDNHEKLFEMMRKGALVAKSFAEASVIVNLQKAFEGWSGHFDESTVMVDAETLYKKANEMEKKAVAFYSDMKQKASSADEIEALEFIVKQEKFHVRMTDALVDFARNPKQWVEDAEFRNLEDEY